MFAFNLSPKPSCMLQNLIKLTLQHHKNLPTISKIIQNIECQRLFTLQMSRSNNLIDVLQSPLEMSTHCLDFKSRFTYSFKDNITLLQLQWLMQILYANLSGNFEDDEIVDDNDKSKILLEMLMTCCTPLLSLITKSKLETPLQHMTIVGFRKSNKKLILSTNRQLVVN
ncbi:hypothetical protein FF38_06252 [Lucilia cuprina]|uniref:Uncharacterized protein n=1 Tax=Lucilia cuprina TaxID=7375 RepID=A0A0L0C764_LUCCU|nr:hypothetical protein FF38_06252 [Lucilia cuprina]